ncbi:MAG: hypothetical protein AB1861_26440 [Cyanobacteriota bacterium]
MSSTTNLPGFGKTEHTRLITGRIGDRTTAIFSYALAVALIVSSII